jgi:flagellar hook-associated protein 1 FlgK
VAITQGSQIAAASPVQATLGAGNTGSLTIGSLALQPLPNNPNAALQQPVTINFTSPTQYTVTTTSGTSAPQTYTPGQAISSPNGWSLTLKGTPANGDSVAVGPGAVSAGDNRNALLMAQAQSQAVVGGSTLDSAYSAVIGTVGAIASAANTDQSSKAAILSNATTTQSSLSGVNLDEEASKLLQYQQQYQAAAKMIQTATNVFDAILAVAGAA